MSKATIAELKGTVGAPQDFSSNSLVFSNDFFESFDYFDSPSFPNTESFVNIPNSEEDVARKLLCVPETTGRIHSHTPDQRELIDTLSKLSKAPTEFEKEHDFNSQSDLFGFPFKSLSKQDPLVNDQLRWIAECKDDEDEDVDSLVKILGDPLNDIFQQKPEVEPNVGNAISLVDVFGDSFRDIFEQDDPIDRDITKVINQETVYGSNNEAIRTSQLIWSSSPNLVNIPRQNNIQPEFPHSDIYGGFCGICKWLPNPNTTKFSTS